MQIRNFHLGDYQSIMNIWQRTGLDKEDGEYLDALAKQLSWDSELVLVAEVDGNVVGVIMGTIDGTRAYFYRLAVLPEYQNRGIGQKLVASLEERFRNKGVSEIMIMVNQKSIPFYHSLGYQIRPLVTLSKPIV